jgi:hypothetical protein
MQREYSGRALNGARTFLWLIARMRTAKQRPRNRYVLRVRTTHKFHSWMLRWSSPSCPDRKLASMFVLRGWLYLLSEIKATHMHTSSTMRWRKFWKCRRELPAELNGR